MRTRRIELLKTNRTNWKHASRVQDMWENRNIIIIVICMIVSPVTFARCRNRNRRKTNTRLWVCGARRAFGTVHLSKPVGNPSRRPYVSRHFHTHTHRGPGLVGNGRAPVRFEDTGNETSSHKHRTKRRTRAGPPLSVTAITTGADGRCSRTAADPAGAARRVSSACGNHFVVAGLSNRFFQAAANSARKRRSHPVRLPSRESRTTGANVVRGDSHNTILLHGVLRARVFLRQRRSYYYDIQNVSRTHCTKKRLLFLTANERFHLWILKRVPRNKALKNER